jgi:hypothetical protein
MIENTIINKNTGGISLDETARILCKSIQIKDNISPKHGSSISIRETAYGLFEECEIENNKGEYVIHVRGTAEFKKCKIRRNHINSSCGGSIIEVAKGGYADLDNDCIVEGNSKPQLCAHPDLNGNLSYSSSIIKDGNFKDG